MFPKASILKRHHSQLQLLLIICFLIAGSILRLLWPDDMEWKSEEKWMFEQAQGIANATLPFPLLGMPSGVRIPNPGMSVWCFALIAHFAHDPIAMVRCIQFLNILVLWLFFGFVNLQIPINQKNTWLWGLAIASVNPLAVLFSRKIWTPDIISPFCFLIFLGHWFRKKFWGSFLWGLFGALIGQVQMGGFFLAFGLLLWTVWHDFQRQTLKETAWSGWFLGSILGSIPLIPWIWAVIPQMGGYTRSIIALVVPKFYSQWVTTALGVNLSYSLEKAFWKDFLREPLIYGISTYLMVPAHIFLLGVGLYPIYKWFKKRKHSHKKDKSGRTPIIKGGWGDLLDLNYQKFRNLLLSPQTASTAKVEPELKFYLNALAWGVGGVFTLSAVNVRPYYIAVVFPFIYIWLALLYKNKLRMLSAIALVQLFITFSFLVFIHRTGGLSGTDYGIVYRLQVEQQLKN